MLTSSSSSSVPALFLFIFSLTFFPYSIAFTPSLSASPFRKATASLELTSSRNNIVSAQPKMQLQQHHSSRQNVLVAHSLGLSLAFIMLPALAVPEAASAQEMGVSDGILLAYETTPPKYVHEPLGKMNRWDGGARNGDLSGRSWYEDHPTTEMKESTLDPANTNINAGEFKRVKRQQGQYAGDKALRVISFLVLPAAAVAIIGGVLLSEDRRQNFR